MYRELTVEQDKDRLLLYWQAELDSPRWYRDSNDTDECTEDTFLEFCSRHRMFEINDSALLYFTKVSPVIGLLHFSVLRKKKLDLCDDIRRILHDELLKDVDIVYGWVYKRNSPLKRLCRQVGLQFNGLMADIPRLNKSTLTAECFALHKKSYNM